MRFFFLVAALLISSSLGSFAVDLSKVAVMGFHMEDKLPTVLQNPILKNRSIQFQLDSSVREFTPEAFGQFMEANHPQADTPQITAGFDRCVVTVPMQGETLLGLPVDHLTLAFAWSKSRLSYQLIRVNFICVKPTDSTVREASEKAKVALVSRLGPIYASVDATVNNWHDNRINCNMALRPPQGAALDLTLHSFARELEIETEDKSNPTPKATAENAKAAATEG